MMAYPKSSFSNWVAGGASYKTSVRGVAPAGLLAGRGTPKDPLAPPDCPFLAASAMAALTAAVTRSLRAAAAAVDSDGRAGTSGTSWSWPLTRFFSCSCFSSLSFLSSFLSSLFALSCPVSWFRSESAKAMPDKDKVNANVNARKRYFTTGSLTGWCCYFRVFGSGLFQEQHQFSFCNELESRAIPSIVRRSPLTAPHLERLSSTPT